MSLGTSNRDGGKTSESGHLRALAKIVTGDVIEGLAASQRAAGINMSVDIAVGDAFVRRSDGSYAHPVFNDAVYNQVISAADGSNPRRDIVVIYVDYGQAPSTAVSNNTNGVVKIKVVNGTPAGSPVDPNDAAIQSSVGAGNPWTKICRVRVPAGQTSIGNSLIDDLRSLINSKTAGTNTVGNTAIQDDAVTKAKMANASVGANEVDTTDWLNASRIMDMRGSNQSHTSSSPVVLVVNSGNVNINHTTKTGRVRVHANLPCQNSANNAQVSVRVDGGTSYQLMNYAGSLWHRGGEIFITGLTKAAHTFELVSTIDGGATFTFPAFSTLTFTVQDY